MKNFETFTSSLEKNGEGILSPCVFPLGIEFFPPVVLVIELRPFPHWGNNVHLSYIINNFCFVCLLSSSQTHIAQAGLLLCPTENALNSLFHLPPPPGPEILSLSPCPACFDVLIGLHVS